jgi:hypothetical protein
MATSEVDICNIAFTAHLGAKSIQSFQDATKEGLLARTSYDEIRDSVLRAHPWNCATKRAAITPDAAAPAWGFDLAYSLPADYLRVTEVEGETVGIDQYTGYKWQIESGKIVTDLTSPLNIKYIYRNTSVGSYDAELVEALSYKLAMTWVEPLIKAANLKEVMHELYRAALSSARGSDGQEGSPRKVESSTWLDVR